MSIDSTDNQFARLFRDSAPYINAFRGRTFVIVFSGDALLSTQFDTLVHDFALLHSLGIKLVLVHGARPQIEQRLQQRGFPEKYVEHLRVTDDAALQCVKDAVGSTRSDIEALLSMGLANSPMAGVRLKVASGNFVIAKPYGIRDGVDYLHTGEIRRIDAHAIQQLLDHNHIVLLSPLGYSPTGETFNVTAESVATASAVALNANKLIYLTETPLLNEEEKPIRQLSINEAKELLNGAHQLNSDLQRIVKSAIDVCDHGVRRVHLVERIRDGALLQELFTRDGAGTLISADNYEGMRQATIEDVPGILELIKPLEQQGILVRRSRERLEMEIDNFTVLERDGMAIACVALYPFIEQRAAELACLAVHPDYQNQGRGNSLLDFIENKAVQAGVTNLYVLSTQTSHWFRERGFAESNVDSLPMEKQSLYNFQRNSKVFVKEIS